MVPPEKKLYSFRIDDARGENRIVLMLPGFGRRPSGKGYPAIGGYYRSRGITPLPVSIDWLHTGIAGLATAAVQIAGEVAASLQGARLCVFGFSFGSVIAYHLAALLPCEHALLCSMSPVFAGDHDHEPFPFGRFMGLVAAFAEPLGYAPRRDGNAVFLYGDRDNVLLRETLPAYRENLFPGSRTVIVPGARHNPAGSAYREAIRQIIGEIQ